MKLYSIVEFLMKLKEISWIDSRKLNDFSKVEKILKMFHGILVPGGFGKDGAFWKN